MTTRALSQVDMAVRQLRNPTPFRGFAAARFEGTFAQAFSQSRWPNDQVDLIDEAAKAPRGQKDIRNNWIAKDTKPDVDVFPSAVGLYIGDFGAGQGVAGIIAEHGQLVIEQNSTTVLRQPLLTVPGGVGIHRSLAATAANDPEAATDGSFYSYEQVGPLTPTGLMALPDNVVFDRDSTLKAYVQITDEARSYLAGLGGDLPSYGAIIGLIVYGVAEYPIGTNR